MLAVAAFLRYESRPCRRARQSRESGRFEAVLRWTTDDLRSRGVDSPRLDAELLLARALGATRIQLIVDAKRELDSHELGSLRELVKRRRTREPMAYILGEREFYGRRFRVDRRVLIPARTPKRSSTSRSGERRRCR